MKGGKGKDVRSMKFDGHCFWCGTHGHMRDDCRKKAAGKPRTARSPTVSSPKGRAKSSEGRKRASSFDERLDVQEDKTSGEKFDEEAVGILIGAASRHEKYSQRDWRAWERIQEQALCHWKSYKSGGFGANSVDA